MALTLGTNCGFVLTAPTADPAASGLVIGDTALVVKATSPAGARKISEIGWYESTTTTHTPRNFEVGLYSADGAVVPGEAGTLLFSSITNTSAHGWNTVTVDWAILPSTVYWIAIQVDTDVDFPAIDSSNTGGNGYDRRTSVTTLPNPFGGGALLDAGGLLAIYAVYKSFVPKIIIT